MFDWIVVLVERGGYVGIALLMLTENLFLLIPSELIMPLAGFSAAQGKSNVVLLVLTVYILYEAYRRFVDPPEILGWPMLSSTSTVKMTAAIFMSRYFAAISSMSGVRAPPVLKYLADHSRNDWGRAVCPESSASTWTWVSMATRSSTMAAATTNCRSGGITVGSQLPKIAVMTAVHQASSSPSLGGSPPIVADRGRGTRISFAVSLITEPG